MFINILGLCRQFFESALIFSFFFNFLCKRLNIDFLEINGLDTHTEGISPN
ncbi:hypothetical protein C943_02224 [Mariniradius saccharolyticus AK6]|uniref:Uncharacterized protein n=1 Tax=Mariniradius saccharolyticus AK6 TaxID=1239962 RepID=M7X9E4_9BACT|nr:hypothetical protein C943_02224 [Mariniradius saccharolyticus AK6]